MNEPQRPAVVIDGPKLKELRRARRDTLKTLAATCGISFQYLSQIERGDRPRVSPPVYSRLCTALELNEDDRQTLLKAAA